MLKNIGGALALASSIGLIVTAASAAPPVKHAAKTVQPKVAAAAPARPNVVWTPHPFPTCGPPVRLIARLLSNHACPE